MKERALWILSSFVQLIHILQSIKIIYIFIICLLKDLDPVDDFDGGVRVPKLVT